MKTLVCYFNVDAFAIQLRDHLISALKDLRIEYEVCHITSLKKTGEKFQPTMTIFFHPNDMADEFRQDIFELKGHKLLWSMEDPWEIDLTTKMLDWGIYYCFTSDQNAADILSTKFDPTRIHYVPHACNPKKHVTKDYEYKHRSDVLFVGNAYPSRLEWFEKNAHKFKKKYMTIIGVGYRGMPGYDQQNIIEGHISEEEMDRYISGTKLVLNLHRQKGDLSMRNTLGSEPSSYNNRYYEVASIGKRQLVVGRGEDHEFKPKNVGKFRKENSYKRRLEDFYLKLIA